MSEPKFKVGDKVWYATFTTHKEVWVECPECLGSGVLTVILGTGERLSIACECCERGYEGSPGKIRAYVPESAVREVVLNGIEYKIGNEPRYRFDEGWIADEHQLFLKQADAEAQARTMAAEFEMEQKEQVKRKEKQEKSWAWHVNYHRREIRRLQSEIERHTARLSEASKKVKEAQ